MMSRIKPEVATTDVDDWVDPQAFPEEDAHELLPLLHNGLRLDWVAWEQAVEFPRLLIAARDPENEEYTLINGVIYSLRTPGGKEADYPRLVLPVTYPDAVISRAHQEVGHVAVQKKLQQLAEANVWEGMRRTIKDQLAQCLNLLGEGWPQG